MLRLISLNLILVLFAGSAFSQEKETIRWLGWEQVPNFIIEGEYKDQGLGDSLTALLQQGLPQYNHELVISNTRRYNTLIREENVCVAWAWIVPGSENFRIHSRAVSLAPRTGIHILKSKQHFFGNPGETLSLAELLSNPNITLGYLEEMTYTKKVHDLLEKYRGENNVHFSSRSEVEFDLSMLDSNRLDYFFGFSSQSIFNAEINNIPNKYQFYNIEEIDRFTSMHTHCSKTPFGKKVMSEIDKILTQDVLMEHLAIVERWYGKNEDYRQVFMDYVINKIPSDLVTNPEN
jgi:uncharacterized protein (TIGR02285 family)